MEFLQQKLQSLALGAVKNSAAALASSMLDALLQRCYGWPGLIAILAAIVLLIAIGGKIVKAVLRPATLAAAALAVVLTLHFSGGLGRLVPSGWLPEDPALAEAAEESPEEDPEEVVTTSAENEPSPLDMPDAFVPALPLGASASQAVSPPLPVSSMVLPPVQVLSDSAGSSPPTGHAGTGGSSSMSSSARHATTTGTAPRVSSRSATAHGATTSNVHTASAKASGVPPAASTTPTNGHPRQTPATAAKAHVPEKLVTEQEAARNRAAIASMLKRLFRSDAPSPAKERPASKTGKATDSGRGMSSSHAPQSVPLQVVAGGNTSHAATRASSDTRRHSGGTLSSHPTGGSGLAAPHPGGFGSPSSSYHGSGLGGGLRSSPLHGGGTLHGGSLGGGYAHPGMGGYGGFGGGVGYMGGGHLGGVYEGHGAAQGMTQHPTIRQQNMMAEQMMDQWMGGSVGGMGGFGHPGMGIGHMGGFGGAGHPMGGMHHMSGHFGGFH